MKQDSVRTTVDIPAPLYQQLKGRAAASGLSIDELLMEGAEKILVENQNAKPYRVKFPLIDSNGPTIDLTNERMYEEIEFP